MQPIYWDFKWFSPHHHAPTDVEINCILTDAPTSPKTDRAFNLLSSLPKIHQKHARFNLKPSKHSRIVAPLILPSSALRSAITKKCNSSHLPNTGQIPTNYRQAKMGKTPLFCRAVNPECAAITDFEIHRDIASLSHVDFGTADLPKQASGC